MTRPAYRGLISMADLADLLGEGWTTSGVRDLMKKMGIGKKRGGRFYVTRTEIRAKDAELAIELEVTAAERG